MAFIEDPKFLDTKVDRRSMLRTVGLAGAGAGLMSLLGGCGGSDSNSGGGGGVSDADVLNFALNLEYLEAEYYVRAISGEGLTAADTGANAGAVTGGKKVNFATPALMQYASEIANDERNHVRFLRGALGGAAVDRPAINFTDAFNAAAKAAGIGDTFDPFADEVSFMLGAFVFEDVGVTAYKGAARLISNKDYLEAAAGILGVEAYHAGAVRTVLYGIGGAAVTNAQKISDLRDNADGGSESDQGISNGGVANIVPTDTNGIAFSRSTDQVLSIVYLGGKGSGGFYPSGLNGTIR